MNKKFRKFSVIGLSCLTLGGFVTPVVSSGYVYASETTNKEPITIRTIENKYAPTLRNDGALVYKMSRTDFEKIVLLNQIKNRAGEIHYGNVRVGDILAISGLVLGYGVPAVQGISLLLGSASVFNTGYIYYSYEQSGHRLSDGDFEVYGSLKIYSDANYSNIFTTFNVHKIYQPNE